MNMKASDKVIIAASVLLVAALKLFYYLISIA